MSSMPPPPPPPPSSFNNYATGKTAPNGAPIAEAWRRIVARLIDSVILGVITAFVVVPAVLTSAERKNYGVLNASNISAGKLVGISLIALAIGFLYEAMVTAFKGGTPGKLMLGMRVVRSADGAPVNLATASVRWAVPGLVSLVPGVGGLIVLILQVVSIVLLFTDKLRQTISDKAAKTVVILAAK